MSDNVVEAEPLGPLQRGSVTADQMGNIIKDNIDAFREAFLELGD